MNFKKRVNGSWTDTPHYIHNTSTDTITTLPAVIYPNDTTATVGLKGNVVQSGTPSHESPVMPQGTGERTGNLLDYTTVESTSFATATQISGGISVSGRYYVQFRTVQFTVGETYTMSWKANLISGESSPSWRFHYSDNTYSSMPSSGGTLIAEKEVSELLLYVGTAASGVVEFTEIMLNEGSTALPYEPYGYKIPISSANTTTPVYLGEVETTRKIKKLVLDGTENWTYSSAYTRFMINLQNVMFSGIRLTPIICTHYITIDDGRSIDDVPNNAIYMGGSVDLTQLFIKTDDYTTAADFKAYLAAQYAAGTPVTVWYVLANETTGIVNEPLRKIGDYADTLSGITIPTIAGANTLTVDTTLQPSEITVNYKGWHPVADVHKRDNGAWT